MHEDLKIPHATEEIVKLTRKYLLKFENHTNKFELICWITV